MLLTDFPLSLLETLILQGQVVNLVVYLHSEVFHCLQYLWISFFQQGDVVTFVLAKDDTFGANGQGVAIKAEILNFFLRVVTTGISHLSERLIVDIK